jgi:choline dehydrogenase-like flavoprotein
LVIVAAGAVETPRLLLANRSSRFPNGLANGSGQVGRNFMETLHWVSTAIAPQSLASFQGLPADAICWDFNAPDAVAGIAGGCRFTSSTQETGFTGPVSYASRIVRGFGAELKQGVRDTFGRALTVGAIGEFLPNEDTRITLDHAQRDAHGMPFPKIHARLTAQDIARLKFMAERCRRSLRDAGASELVEEYGSYDFFSAPHVAGTCRMGSEPRASVVNGFGRAHEVANLFVADASVFPSAGGGEGPSLTIEALAIRTADFIARGSVLPASALPKRDRETPGGVTSGPSP